MKGRSTNAAQRRFHDALCSTVGCIACRLDGRVNLYCSVHHIDGRTKPWAHWLVLSLCAGHHQDGTGAPGLIAVHPHQGRFELRYGDQRHLLRRSLDILEQHSVQVPELARHAANGQWARMVA